MQTETPQTVFIKPEDDHLTFDLSTHLPKGPLTRYYHAPAIHPHTFRRYSAAAQLRESTRGFYLLIAYSICSEEDTFIKSKARFELDRQLFRDEGHKFYLEVDANINKWGQVFIDFVKHIVPAATMPKDTSWEIFRGVCKQMKAEYPDQVRPTSPSNCYIQVKQRDPAPEEVQQLLSKIMQQADTDILGKSTRGIATA